MPVPSRPPSPKPEALRRGKDLEPQDIDQTTLTPEGPHQTKAISRSNPRTSDPSVGMKPAKVASTTVADTGPQAEPERARRGLQEYSITLGRLSRVKRKQNLELRQKMNTRAALVLQQKMNTTAYSYIGTQRDFGGCGALELHTMTAMTSARAGIDYSSSRGDSIAVQNHGKELMQSEHQGKQRLHQASAGLHESACIDDA